VTVALDLAGLGSDEADAVRSAWRDCAAPAGAAVDVTIRVRDDGDVADLAHVLERLSQRVTLAAIGARRGQLWMLHAAGLALPDGKVIALIGPSGRGKTTASRALGAELGYVSDETVGIDVDGRVWPYRKPLSIIEGGRGPKVQRAPSALGLQPLPGAELQLAAIVLLQREADGPDAPRVEPVDMGDALEELVAQSSYLSSMDAPLQLIAGLAAQTGGLRRVVYREAATLSAVIRSLAERRPSGAWSGRTPRSLSERGETKRPDVPATTPRSLSERSETKRADPFAELWFRTPFHDAIDLDDPDRIAVLQVDERDEGMLRVLAGIAPALWRAAEGASHEDLVTAAVAAHGEPEGQDAGALVDAALTGVADGGLLERRAPRWGIREDVAWTGEGGRYVVLSLADAAARPQVLEGSAALIWAALAEGEAPVADLSARVAGVAGVTSDVVEGDVAAFVAELRVGDLVHTC